MNGLEFRETQRFRQWWMWVAYALLSGLLLLFMYGAIQKIFLGRRFGDKPVPDIVLLLIILVVFATLLVLYAASLTTIINEKGIFYRWTPFSKSYTHISWNNVIDTEIANYSFVGYGWRLTSYGTVHNVAGNIGFKLTLKSGKKLIVGTQKPDELSLYLKKIGKKT
jgi:hypothetical protein